MNIDKNFKFNFPKEINPRPHLMIYWFLFLRLSPSYQLATKVRSGILNENDIDQLPKDFKLVLKTYDDFGDVWASDYVTWTKDKWRKLFDANIVPPEAKTLALLREGEATLPEGRLDENLKRYFEQYRPSINYPMTFIMALPVIGNKKRILDEVSFLLDRYDDFIHNAPALYSVPKPKYTLLITKIRNTVLKLSHQIILIKASNPHWRLWHIAIKLKISPTQSEIIKTSEKIRLALKEKGQKPHSSQKATDEKLFLNAVMGRYIRHAYLLAENAARGQFPSINERYDEHGKKEKTYFDYLKIRQLLDEENSKRALMDD